MRVARLKGISLLWRILLSTSIAITALFALTGWMVQTYAVRVSQRSIEEEVRTSLQAYQALWNARAHSIAVVSRIISSMSDVRAAFMTGDRATIRDTAGQLWSQISEQDALFLVLDPTGNVIASLGGEYPGFSLNAVHLQTAMKVFPKQVAGYARRGDHLYYVVLTPVYVESSTGRALLNILLVAVDINTNLAHTLKTSTHGSDFIFTADRAIVATTLALNTTARLGLGSPASGGIHRMARNGTSYLVLGTALRDIDQRPIGALYVVRSFVGPGRAFAALQRNVALIWLVAVAVGLGLTYLLARRILDPVKRLDKAAGEVIKQNYDYRVPVETEDELGRLANTFNTMCDSIRAARNDLIRQERIATIGRFASSIVHDLRSPLAAIYGGAEMLVDTNLSDEQTRRLAANMYLASRRIQELLQDLTNAGRSGVRSVEVCRVADLVNAGCESISDRATSARVSITLQIPSDLEVPVERGPVERVFINLLENALEAMPSGGQIHVTASQQQDDVVVRIQDTGPGLPDHAWTTLFEPFATFGKPNGLGLGLALSRQTVLDHGGDLWAERTAQAGALFYMRLPTAKSSQTQTRDNSLNIEQNTSAV
jgi:signal transduction histidine kinase